MQDIYSKGPRPPPQTITTDKDSIYSLWATRASLSHISVPHMHYCGDYTITGGALDTNYSCAMACLLDYDSQGWREA